MTIIKSFFNSIKSSINFKLVATRNKIITIPNTRVEIAHLKTLNSLSTFSFKN